MAGFVIGVGVADGVELYAGAMTARCGGCGHWLAAHGREYSDAGELAWDNGPCTHQLGVIPGVVEPDPDRRCPCPGWVPEPLEPS